ncbi:hypothetical protein SK128_008500, partial [Halocaridina rubra]
ILVDIKMDKRKAIVCVIKALNDCVVLNHALSKTKKVRFFSPKVVHQILYLLDWEMPKETDASIGEEDQNVNGDGNDVQQEALKLLINLFSSYKYGIVFKIRVCQHQGTKSNSYAYNILYELDRPWYSPLKRQLFSHFFSACPEVLPKYLEANMQWFSPRPAVAFISLMDMVVQIMKCQKPWNLAQSKGWQSVVACLFPGYPLSPKFYLSLAQSSHEAVRYVGCSLMFSILSKITETLENLTTSTVSAEIKDKIEEELRNKASSIFSAQVLEASINTWKKLTEKVEEDQCECYSEIASNGQTVVPVAMELLQIVRFLSLYNKLFPTNVIDEFLEPVYMIKTLKALYRLGAQDANQYGLIRKIFNMISEGLLEKSINRDFGTVSNQFLEENLFYLLIKTYAQYQGSSDDALGSDVCGCLVKILSSLLLKFGLLEDSGGSVKYWLRHIPDCENEKLSLFFTQVIQHSLSFYGQHTNELVKLANKYSRTKSSSVNHVFKSLDVFEEPTALKFLVVKPFSRLLLAATELLSTEPDNKCKMYFSSVVCDYVHSLHHPEVLILFLLEKSSVIMDSLKEYLIHFQKSGHNIKVKLPMPKADDMSDILKYLFVTEDWSSVEGTISSINFKTQIKDLHLVVLQILLYLRIESQKETAEQSDLAERYARLLKDIYKAYEQCDQSRSEMIIRTTLEHPHIKLSFKPVTLVVSPIHNLCEYFICTALAKYTNLVSCLYPYYLETVMQVRTFALQSELNDNCLNALNLFILSECIVLSYKDVEELTLLILRAASDFSLSISNILVTTTELLLKTTNAKHQPSEECVLLMFNKFLEWSRVGESECHNNLNSSLAVLEKLLLKSLTKNMAEKLSHDDLKRLLHIRPPCIDLCCRIVSLYPAHGSYVASRMQKIKSFPLPDQLQLLLLLLDNEESSETALKVLPELKPEIMEWAMGNESYPAYFQNIFVHAINAGIIDDGILSVCSHVFNKVLNDKWFPRNNITYLSLLIQRLSEDEVSQKLPMGSGNLYLVHISLHIIKNAYKKDACHTELCLNCYQMLKDILPNTNGDFLQFSLRDNKLWSSFVKQVLRNGLHDLNIGPELILMLNLLISIVYKSAARKDDELLSLITIYQMIMSHTQYLQLMFQRDIEWDRLKENVVALQQTIVHLESNVCLEEHVPIFLSAYGASMSAADQRILKLLFTYEALGFMKRYQPVLWGDCAVSHFGMLSSGNEQYLEPKVEQVLSLLEKDKIIRSCFSFNTDMSLHPMEIWGDDRTVYDIRFLIPLMLYITEDKRVLEIDLAECGTVALGFACLSSYKEDVWAAGTAILKRVFEKMVDSKQGRLKLPWIWSITIVMGSFDGVRRRLSSVIAHYLLNVVRLLSNPCDPMYLPVLRALFIRPEMETHIIPQFARLFTSSDVFDNQVHLSFLLQCLSTGIRQPFDYILCERTNTIMLLLSLLRSPTADSNIKLQILDVLEALAQIPIAGKDLVKKHNILILLPLVVESAVSATYASSATKSSAYVGRSLIIASIVKILHDVLFCMLIRERRKKAKRKATEHSANKRKRNEESSDEEAEKKALEEECERKNAFQTVIPENEVPEMCEEQVFTVTRKIESLENKPRFEFLPLLFTEEYMNCMLRISHSVFNHAPPQSSATLLNLICTTLQYLDKGRRLAKKKSFHVIAMDPHVIKAQVRALIDWEFLHTCLKEYLTDSEEVRLLGPKVALYRQEWHNECLALQLRRGDQRSICEEGDFHELKLAVLNLLNVLE